MSTNQPGGFAPKRLTRLTNHLQGCVDRGEVAGVVTLLYRKGVEAHSDIIGWQDETARIPVRRDTIFRIASMTKPIASVAALMLMEEGRLRLDDPITRWLPEFSSPKVLRDPAGPLDDTYRSPRPITVFDLLTHRAGLVSQFAAAGPIAAEAAKLHVGNGLLLKGADPDSWLARLAALPLVSEPGRMFNYGFSTDVLGLLVGRVAGMGLADFLGLRLFEPLGMADTGFHVPEGKRDRFAVAHAAGPSGRRVVIDHPNKSPWTTPQAIPSGSAGLVSTADDYLKFGRMLLEGGRLNGERFLSRKTIELMTTDFLTAEQRRQGFFGVDLWAARGFGLGVFVVDRLAAQVGLGSIGRYGWGGAFGTAWSNDPREGLVMILMIQLQSALSGSTIEPDFVNLVYQAIDD